MRIGKPGTPSMRHETMYPESQQNKITVIAEGLRMVKLMNAGAKLMNAGAINNTINHLYFPHIKLNKLPTMEPNTISANNVLID